MELTCQKEGSLLFVKAAEEATGYVAQSSPGSNTPFPVGRARFHKNNVQTTKRNRRAHHHILLRPLSELTAQRLYMVFVHWSQQECVEGRQHLVSWQVLAHKCLEERQQDLVAEAWVGAKRSGFVQSLPDDNRRGRTLCTTMRLTMNFIDSNKPFR